MMTVVMGISCMGMPIAGVLLLGPLALSMACSRVWQQQRGIRGCQVTRVAPAPIVAVIMMHTWHQQECSNGRAGAAPVGV
jgi:hypothetical protein